MKRVLLLPLILAACAGDDDRPAPAPTGSLIAFASNRDGDFDIYVMRPDGTETRNLTRNASNARSEADDDWPAWSADGRLLAFTSTRDHRGDGDEARDVYVMKPDGSDVRRLTENNVAERSVDWLPDGRVIFWRCSGGIYGCSLIAISADGDDEQKLFDAGHGVTSLAVAPDGSKIAFDRTDVMSASSSSDIYVADLDGDERRVTTGPGVDGGPVWSPDGKRIAFVSDRDRNGPCFFHDCTGFAPELYLMDADGSDQRRITEDPAYDLFPSWSPDGKRLVFARLRSENEDYELHVVDADGGEPRRIPAASGWSFMPDWSPPLR